MPQSNPERDLYRLFLDAGRRTRRVHKWHHYFDIYERFMAPFRGRPVTLLEIGVYQGGSLEMWRAYLGPRARVVGIDVDPSCAAHAGDGAEVFIGDQADSAFLRRVLDEVGPPAIVVDDGGHTANQQITSFEALYPELPCPGVYLVEDTHTALWGGGYADRHDGRSFLDHAFDRCRSLHEWTSEAAPVSDFCRRTGSVSFFDSVVVFERADRQEPWHEVR